MTRAEARELARHILSHTKENNLVTNEHMLKIFERLYDYGGLLVYFEDNKLKKTTYYKYKSAYQYGAALKMRSLFSEADKVEKTDPEQARECRRQALALGEEVKKLSPDYEKAHRFLDNQDNSVIKPYSDDKISSKRKYLKGLPENWVGMIIDELPIMHQDAAVLMAVTGCRPAELENGVLLESVDEEYLKVTIKGAKYKKGKQGQKKRTVTLAGWFVPHLFNLAYEQPREISINDESFRKAVRRKAKKLGFKGVSPYCFRHQFSANLKAELGDRWTHEDLAKALGHITDRCQQYYGHPNQKRGRGSGIMEVQASGPVKENRGKFLEQANSLNFKTG